MQLFFRPACPVRPLFFALRIKSRRRRGQTSLPMVYYITMRTNVAKGMALAAVVGVGLAFTAVADEMIEPYAKTKEQKTQRVMLTGSYIPQKVKVKSIGTATQSNLRVVGRKEIEQSSRAGRSTAAEIAAEADPALGR